MHQVGVSMPPRWQEGEERPETKGTLGEAGQLVWKIEPLQS